MSGPGSAIAEPGQGHFDNCIRSFENVSSADISKILGLVVETIRRLSLPGLVAHEPDQNLKNGQAERPISTGQLRTLLLLHTQPIKLVVYEWSYYPSRSWENLS